MAMNGCCQPELCLHKYRFAVPPLFMLTCYITFADLHTSPEATQQQQQQISTQGSARLCFTP